MHTRISLRKNVLGMAISGSLLCTPAIASDNAVEKSSPNMLNTQEVFAQLGLTPDLLSASGVSRSEACTVFVAAFNSFSIRWTNYSAVQSAVNALLAQQRTINQQLADENEGLNIEKRVLLSAELANNKELLRMQKITLQTLRAEIDRKALDSMSTEDRTRFVQIRSNKYPSVPVEYRILDIDDESWLELQHAFAAVKTNEHPSSKMLKIVSDYDGMVEVSLARVNHETNFETVNTAFTSFLVSLDAE